MSDPLDAAKREQERTTQMLLDAKKQLTDAMDAKAGPPADDPVQAQQQLRAIRAELDRDLATLQRRVPEPQEIVQRVRPAAIAIGGGVAAIALVLKRRSSRRERREHEEALREQATALAKSFARLDLAAIAEEAAAEREAEEAGGRGKLVAVLLGAAAAGAVVWARARTREEPEVWAPSPLVDDPRPPASEPLTAGHPAAPTDITTEVPTIPVRDPAVSPDPPADRD